MRPSLSLRSLFLSTAAACALTACGGGSDDAPSPPPPPPPPEVSPTCPTLTSGTYRVIVPQMANAGEYATDTMHINAVTGVTTATNDPTDVGQLTPTGTCTFSGSSGGEIVVSSAGVVVFRSEEDGVMRLGLAFREQAIPLADLAGDWQLLGFERSDTTNLYEAVAGAGTLAAGGAFTLTRECPDVMTCSTSIPAMSINLTANTTAGGFNLVNSTENWTDRVFAYRAGSDLMLVALAGNGSFSLWTPQRSLTLPTVGSRAASWGMWTNPSLVSANAVSPSDFTNGAGDVATGSFTRVSNLDGHSETLLINTPNAGMSFRPETTATTTGGATVTVREFASLPLRGMGVAALSLPTLGGGAYFLSVTTP
jgi:hypothetical protein